MTHDLAVLRGGTALDDVLLRSLYAVEQAVCVVDVSLPDQPLVWANPAFEQDTGYPPTESVGRNCRFLQDGLRELGHDTATPAARLRALIRARRPGTVVIPNRRRDGTVFLNELSLSPLPEADGSVRYFVAVQRDVTSRFEAEAARDAAHREFADLAEEMRRQLVPFRLPQVPGLDIAVRYQPATRFDGSSGQVSGDFYDLRELPGGHVVVVVGDVSGRGPSAAATTAAVRWAIRGATREGDGPAELLRRTSVAVHDALDEQFATVAVVRLPPTGALTGAPTLSLAGHPRPVLLPADGAPRFVGRAGMLLGPFDEVDLYDEQFPFPRGSCLLLYTDGVTEATDPANRLLGERELLATVAGLPTHEPARIADAVAERVARHVGSGPTDDLTLMVLRRT